LEKKFAIPDDCSIVGFDNIAISAYTVPSLTVFEQAKYELGYAAARIMINILNNEVQEDQIAKTEILRGTLIIRASTAPPKI
jgi:LacI family transcriptional regulator